MVNGGDELRECSLHHKSRYQILGIAIGCQSMAMPQPRNVDGRNEYGGILLLFFFFLMMMMIMMMMIHTKGSH
jgi:hypothetical protein